MLIGPGQTLSHYRLVETIGEGGMGVVWKAEDTVLNRTVAIKVLPADVSRDEKRREMFLQEAQLAAQVGDAHIVQVHEFGHEGGLDFIVMEFVEGKPLNKMLHGRPLPPHKVADFGHQVARALSRAHRKQLLHRDLKPANILVTPDGEAKVVDFGLATLFEPSSLSQTATRTTEEAPHDRKLAGTLSYMSPEQARMEPLDGRSDVFSLGAILYEMTTGQMPFAGRTPSDVLQAVQQARPKPVHDLVPQVPLELDRIIGKAMAPRQRDRYQSMEDLAVDLNRLERELESGSSPSYEDLAKTASPRHRSKRRLIGTAGALALVAIALGVWWFGFRPGGRLDERTLLILPMMVKGQEQGAEYFGQAFAEAIASNLAQYENLSIPPVPTARRPVGDDGRDLARRVGARRVLTGTITREAGIIRASFQLLDTRENRLLWGTQESVPEDEFPSVAALIARKVSAELNVPEPKLYMYPRYFTGSTAMASSPELAEALGALKRNDDTTISANRRLVEAFPDELESYTFAAFGYYSVWLSEPTPEHRTAFEDSLVPLDAIDPDNPYGALFRAMLLDEGDGQPREAIGLYDQILARSDLSGPLRAWVLRNRADAAWRVKDTEGALKHIEEALRLDPLHPTNYLVLSRILANAGAFAEAAVRIRQAVALRPEDPVVCFRLGWIQYRLGEIDEAAEILGETCRRHRRQGACALRAASLQRMGREADAIEAVQEASELVDYGEGNVELARFWMLRGDSDRALSYLRRSAELGIVDSEVMIDTLLTDDADFSSLHGDPEFEAIVAEIKKRLGQE